MYPKMWYNHNTLIPAGSTILMSNLALAQKLNLFNDFVQHWREVVGRDLIVLSHEGEVLTHTNGARWGNWRNLLNQLSPDKPTFLIYSNQRLLTVPMLDGQQPLGYLLVFDAQEHDELLLAWGAKTIVARLVGEE